MLYYKKALLWGRVPQHLTEDERRKRHSHQKGKKYKDTSGFIEGNKGKNKGRVYCAKDGISKSFLPPDLQKAIDEGWVIKSKHKLKILLQNGLVLPY